MARQTITKDKLDAKISALAKEIEDCKDVAPSGVHWHERDKGGCNWDVHWFTGHGTAPGPCAKAIRPRIEELRAAFEIPDEK